MLRRHLFFLTIAIILVSISSSNVVRAQGGRLDTVLDGLKIQIAFHAIPANEAWPRDKTAEKAEHCLALQ